MLGSICLARLFGAQCDTPSHVGTPPAPPVNTWTLAPADQAQADALVQSISNQTVTNQQAIDASGVKYVAEWVPSFLVPNPSNPSDPNNPIPWNTYLVVGLAVFGIILVGGRR